MIARTIVAAAAAMLAFTAKPALAQQTPVAAETPATPAEPSSQPVHATLQTTGADLAQQLSNPVASLISVPFQHNIDCCFGPDGAIRYTLNIQPVVPVSLNDDWNVIIRTIVPIIYQESTVAGGSDAFGLGDTVQSFFFSPKEVHNGLVWAVGPVFLYPTGESRLGSERWGAGPTALVLKQSAGGITYGMLANQIWSFAGDDSRSDVSSMLLQPFFAKSWPDSTTFNLNSETTYDWIADSWTVPVNVGVSHIYRFGRQPVQVAAIGRYYVVSPDGGPDWGVRLVFTLLFPE